MLFPTTLLKTVDLPSLALAESSPNLETFRASLKTLAFPEFAECVDVNDFRDVAEDILERYGIHEDFVVPKSEKRAAACTTALCSILTEKAGASLEYTDYILCKACEEWLAFTDPYVTMRPRLKTPTPELEKILDTIAESLDACTFTTVRAWSDQLSSSVLSVLSIVYAALKSLDLDDTFVHAPKSSVKGSTCVLRDAALGVPSVKVCKNQSPDVARGLVVVHDGVVSVRTADGSFQAFKEPNAFLGVPVPGTDVVVHGSLRRYLIVAKSSTAAVLALTFTDKGISVNKRLEIDLEESVPIDFLDCQRDRDANIVLMWGHKNHLTGAADVKYFAWSEDEFVSKRMNMTALDTSKLPPRNVNGTKIDFRDHGNLLALVTSVSETNEHSKRSFVWQQQVLFGSSILPSLPERAQLVFGMPTDFTYIASSGIHRVKDGKASKLASGVPNPMSATALVVYYS